MKRMFLRVYYCLLSLFAKAKFGQKHGARGSDRRKPNATETPLNQKRRHIDREVTPLQDLTGRAEFKNGDAIAICSQRLQIAMQFEFESC